MQLLHQPISASDPIPDRFYIIIMEIFCRCVTEVPPRETSPCSGKEKWLFSQATQSKTPVKCLGYAWGEMGNFGIDWYTCTCIKPSLK